jgi:hypothetical protein
MGIYRQRSQAGEFLHQPGEVLRKGLLEIEFRFPPFSEMMADMKMTLALCVTFGCGLLSFGAEASKSAEAAVEKKPKPVSTYRDVLAVIPKEMEPWNARQWSQSDRDVANTIIQKKIVDARRPASMKLRVGDVADWGRMTLYCEISNDEGYPIRVFAGPNDPAFLPKLATLKPGDSILLEGVLEKVTFEHLWGSASLSICVKDGKVTKLTHDGKVAPLPAVVGLSVVSAVYGSGDRFSDVTGRVKDLLGEPGAAFVAKPSWLGADPTPGWNKALVIVYEHAGKRQIFSTGEGGAVSAALMVTQIQTL